MSMTDAVNSTTDLRRARRAILVADVVESVRLIEADEDRIVRRWRAFVDLAVRTLVDPAGGRLVKSLGDGMLIEFADAHAAVHCATEMIAAMDRENGHSADDRRIELRIGIHAAEVFVDALDVYGIGVNLAARLTSMAGPGQIVVSAAVRDAIADCADAKPERMTEPAIELEDLGECHLRHLPGPVRAFRFGRSGPRPAPSLAIAAADPLAAGIAVLAFTDRDAVSGASCVGEIIADALVTYLSRSPELRVISRLSTSHVQWRPPDAQRIGSALGARYVLHGSHRRHRGQLILQVELADVVSHSVVWADRRIGSAKDVLFGQGDVLHRITEDARLALKANEIRRATLHPMPTLESSTLLIAAVAMLHRSMPRDFDRARVLFEHLIERHRRNPIPRAWLAKWHVLRVTRGVASADADTFRCALEQTRRALDQDPECSLALAVEGFVHCHLSRDLDSALSCYDSAITVNPNESLAWLFKGVAHSFRGEAAAAAQAADRALQLSPRDPMLYFYQSLAASAMLPSGNYARVEQLAQASLKSNRLHSSTYRALAIAQALSGQVEKARETVRDLLRIEPGFTVQQYLHRSPSTRARMGSIYVDAFRMAGVPEG